MPTERGFRFAAILTLTVGAILGTVLVGANLGKHVFRDSIDKNRLDATPFAVAGPSMAPTVLGPSRKLECPHCEKSLIVADSPPAANSELTCRECGANIPISQWQSSEVIAPDVVWLQPSLPEQLRRGQLVAINRDGKRHLKRLVGLPGETVSTQAGRLLVNDTRIEDALPTLQPIRPGVVLVCRDDRNWKPQSVPRLKGTPVNPVNNPWQWTPDGWQGSPDSNWLVYHHRNPHNDFRASGVMDDYAVNATLNRKLYPCDRLVLQWTGLSSQDAVVEIAFWSPDEARVTESQIPAGPVPAHGQVSWYDRAAYDATAGDELPVSETQPLAIRVQSGRLDQVTFVVSRFVEYRLMTSHSRDRYPITLDADQYFVLGDNVPVSVDSRQFGPINAADILGVCTR